MTTPVRQPMLVWNFPTKAHEYSDPWYLLSNACQRNQIKLVQNLFIRTNVDPFYLMGMVIHGNGTDMTTWNYMIQFLKKEDVSRTFLDYKDKEHSLLSYLCSLHHDDFSIATLKINSLLDIGCSLDQLVGEKTPLSYLVERDNRFPLLTWCITDKGANPHLGHLLVYASQFYGAENSHVFSYLLSLGLNIEDRLENGMTPFLAACESYDFLKITQLLEKDVSIYRKTKEGIDAWYYVTCNGYKYPNRLRELLQEHDTRQKQFWTMLFEEIAHESNVKDIPIQEIIQVLVKG